MFVVCWDVLVHGDKRIKTLAHKYLLMIPSGGFRMLSRHPVRDRVEIYAERAGKFGRDAKARFGRYANLGIDGICVGIWKFLDAEDRAEKFVKESAARQVAKARALAMILAIWRTSYECAEIERARKMEEGTGLPRPPRGGAVFQDASCWFDECGTSRYPVSGRGAVAIFDAQHNP